MQPAAMLRGETSAASLVSEVAQDQFTLCLWRCLSLCRGTMLSYGGLNRHWGPERRQLQMHGGMDIRVRPGGFTCMDMRIVSGVGGQCDHCTDQRKANADR